MSKLSKKNGKLNLKPWTLKELIGKFKRLKFKSLSSCDIKGKYILYIVYIGCSFAPIYSIGAKVHPRLWLRVDQWDRGVICLGMHRIELKKRPLRQNYTTMTNTAAHINPLIPTWNLTPTANFLTLNHQTSVLFLDVLTWTKHSTTQPWILPTPSASTVTLVRCPRSMEDVAHPLILLHWRDLRGRSLSVLISTHSQEGQTTSPGFFN